ncbi:MAG TPA: RNA-binding protein [Xanthobacteraceae bacterium]
MPKGSRGEKLPADVIGGAVKVMRIATIEEPDDREDTPTLTPGQQLRKLGGVARAKSLTAEQRQEIAREGATKRWGKKEAN